MKKNKFFSGLKDVLKSSILAFSFFVGSVAFGQQTPAPQIPANEYQRIVGDVVFSLETIENGSLVNEMHRLQLQVGGAVLDNDGRISRAGGAITAQIAADVAEKQMTAWELLMTIIEDTRLTNAQRNDYVEKLGAPLGRLFALSIIHQGDDVLNADLRANARAASFLSRSATEWVRTFTDLFTFHRMTDQRAIDMAIQDRIPRNLTQLPNEGQRVWKLKERMYREWLSQTMTINAQRVMNRLGEGNSTVQGYKGMRFMLMVPQEKKENAQDLGTAEIALQTRQGRVSAHRVVLGTIGFAAAMWTMFPVDYVGMMTGYDLVTARISDFISYGALTTLGMLRSASGSFGTIPQLRHLLTILNNPTVHADYSPMRLPLMARLLRIRSKVEAARVRLGYSRGANQTPANGGGARAVISCEGAFAGI